MRPCEALLFGCSLISHCVTDSVGAEPQGQNEFYAPVERLVEGWTVACDPQLLSPRHAVVAERTFKALANHLQRVEFTVPSNRLAELRSIRIWIDLKHPKLKSMQYHPSRDWLRNNGHDVRLAKHVHIPNAQNLVARHMWAKHPYVVLHELAHGFHDQVLGFGHAELKAAWDQAKSTGILDEVLLHTGERGPHYGRTNHKEYFAESTEAYFGVNDFYPFVRSELKAHDPRMFSTLKTIWGPVP